MNSTELLKTPGELRVITLRDYEHSSEFLPSQAQDFKIYFNQRAGRLVSLPLEFERSTDKVKLSPDLEAQRAAWWQSFSLEQQNLGKIAYDGTQDRVKAVRVFPDNIVIETSAITYSQLKFTSQEANQDLLENRGRVETKTLAYNCIPVSSNDHWGIVLRGGFNNSYSNHLHPVAGHSEGKELEQGILDELLEEVGVLGEDVVEIIPIGLIDIGGILEVLTVAKLNKTATEIRQRKNLEEPEMLWFFPSDLDWIYAVAQGFAAHGESSEKYFTPDGIAHVALYAGMRHTLEDMKQVIQAYRANS